jgi:hypothetical protein
MSRARASFAALAVLVAAGGCVGSAFVCEQDDACRDGDLVGVCEAQGSCSFPDDACTSGRRFGVHAPGAIAGQCVPVDDPQTTGSVAGTSSSTTIGLDGTSPSSSSLDAADGGPGSTTATGVVSDGTTGGCPADWFDCASPRRLRLLAASPSPQSGVPVPVRLTPERFDYDIAAPGGADLRVLDGSGVAVPFEIEVWDPAGESIVWVRVDLADAVEPTLALYWGGPDPGLDGSPAAVWADHAAVFHLGASLVDATGQSQPGVAAGSTQTGLGFLGEAQTFFDAESRLDVAAGPAIADLCLTGCTISAWIFAEGWGGTNRGRIADKSGGGGGGWMFYGSGDDGGDLRLRHGYPTGQVIWSTPAGSLTLGDWHHVAASFDAGAGEPPRLYVDGVELEVTADAPVISDASPDLDNALLIGNSQLPDRWFDGTIDELRLEPVVRPPEWIAVQYVATTDALFEYGPVESLP